MGRGRGVVAAATLAVVALVAAGCEWAFPRADAGRSGHNPYESTIGVGNVEDLTELWSRPLAAPGTEPIVVGATVVVAQPGLNGGPGHVTAFDAATGEPRWGQSFPGAGCRPVGCFSPTPSVGGADGVVYVAVFFTTQGGLAAYDAATGAPIRSYTGASATGPVVYGDTLYAGTYGEGTGLAAWDVANGDLRFRAPQSLPVSSGPAVGEGLVFTTWNSRLEVFDTAGSAGCTGSPTTCEPVWTAEAAGTTAVAGGRVHVGRHAYDAAGCGQPTCPPLWTAETAQGAVPAVADGTLYLADGAGLAAFDATGCGTPTCPPLWTGSGAVGTLSVANGVVYGTSGATLRAYDSAGCDAPRCDPLWETTFPAAIRAPVAIAGGRILVVTADSVLHALALGA